MVSMSKYYNNGTENSAFLQNNEANWTKQTSEIRLSDKFEETKTDVKTLNFRHQLTDMLQEDKVLNQ